jgi:integrase
VHRRYDDLIRPPSPNETTNILEHNAVHLIRAIGLSHYTGISPGASELFNRVWDDVDFNAQILFVVPAKNGEEGHHKSTAEIIGHSRTEALIWILSAYRS